MAIAYNPQIVTSGLVLYLDAGNVKSYPGSGTVCTDISGNGNNGTLVNGVGFNSANGGSFTFDGVNDYISVPNSSSINPNTGSFSIVVWANSDPSNGGDSWDLWVAKRINGTNGYYLGANNPSGVKFMVGNNADGRTDTGYISYSFNTWAMFTAVLDRGANTQRVVRNDNAEIATVTPLGGTYSNTGILSIGGDFGNASQFYVNGRVPIVQLYSKALTSAEITQNFSALRGRFGL